HATATHTSLRGSPPAPTAAPPRPRRSTRAPADAAPTAPILVTGSATDPNPGDGTADFTYAWAVLRTRGGATAPYGSFQGSSFTLIPDDAGSYSIILTVTDPDVDCSASVTQAITVTNVDP